MAKALRMRIEVEDPLYHGQKKLKVRGKDLSNLSNAVFNLLELEVLDLSPEREACLDYKLSFLPPGIGRLVNLTTLMLDTNDLEEVPAEIALLQNLERMALSNNRLSSLPTEFQKLKALRSLHMANNLFQDMPVQLCELKSLEFLDMSDNQIKFLPEKINRLVNLQTLLLFINQLTRLPDSICTMTELRCLWVGNNRLRSLPRNFGQLVRLDWGHRYTSSALEGNPLIHPPLEICRMGPHAIDRYMKAGVMRKEEKPTPRQEETPREETPTQDKQDPWEERQTPRLDRPIRREEGQEVLRTNRQTLGQERLAARADREKDYSRRMVNGGVREYRT